MQTYCLIAYFEILWERYSVLLSKVEVMTVFPACSFLENIYNEYTRAYKMIVANL